MTQLIGQVVAKPQVTSQIVTRNVMMSLLATAVRTLYGPGRGIRIEDQIIRVELDDFSDQIGAGLFRNSDGVWIGVPPGNEGLFLGSDGPGKLPRYKAVTLAEQAASTLTGNPTGSAAVPIPVLLSSRLRFTGETTLDLSPGAIGLSYLEEIAAKTILANITGSAASPQAATITQILDLMDGATENGNVAVREGGKWIKRAKGALGQFFRMQAGDKPGWAGLGLQCQFRKLSTSDPTFAVPENTIIALNWINGGGGSGYGGAPTNVRHGGGAGGGCAFKIILMPQDATWDIQIGAGGGPKSSGTGNPGANSQITSANDFSTPLVGLGGPGGPSAIGGAAVSGTGGDYHYFSDHGTASPGNNNGVGLGGRGGGPWGGVGGGPNIASPGGWPGGGGSCSNHTSGDSGPGADGGYFGLLYTLAE